MITWVNMSYNDLGALRNNEILHCGSCGAYVPYMNKQQHINFHETFGHAKEQGMSKVSWCDPGNHAFKAGEDGSASFSGVQHIEGRPVDVTQDVCRKHNPYNTTVEIETAIAQRSVDLNTQEW